MRRAKRFGRYQLIERIGAGGMAELYRGFTWEPDGFRRDVAIKRLTPEVGDDRREQYLQMLLDEFRVISCLRHPNVVEVYELGEFEGEIFIAMEYVDGRDLRATIEQARSRGVPIRIEDAVYLMIEALAGLHYAHQAVGDDGRPLHVVHRDFSPANVLVGYDGRVKICDFGVAKTRLSRTRTRTGVIKGKVRYMSPEQAYGKPLDARSDVFSAGAVLYELLAGRPAFAARDEMELLRQVRTAKPRPLRELAPEVPEALAAIVARAMARERTRRYPTAGHFRDALRRFLRTYRPDYRRTRLATLMRTLWQEDIEQELRTLEELVLDLPGPEEPLELGRNLLADALGEAAPYRAFRPSPPGAAASEPKPAPGEEPTVQLVKPESDAARRR